MVRERRAASKRGRSRTLTSPRELWGGCWVSGCVCGAYWPPTLQCPPPCCPPRCIQASSVVSCSDPLHHPTSEPTPSECSDHPVSMNIG